MLEVRIKSLKKQRAQEITKETTNFKIYLKESVKCKTNKERLYKH